MIRRLHLVSLIALIAASGVSGFGASVGGAPNGTVSGIVRDSAGVPQLGAAVELLRPDLTVVAAVYTNNKGLYTFSKVLPGHYAVKAMGTSFLPSL
ncbi:MAG TPA: carboxypeptidase-like regulatory domain-containing protein, partial [Nitrospira sp.]|nr:carboxypeptidase-like regulatory domain-containing protein [Nitrospira sp.]